MTSQITLSCIPKANFLWAINVLKEEDYLATISTPRDGIIGFVDTDELKEIARKDKYKDNEYYLALINQDELFSGWATASVADAEFYLQHSRRQDIHAALSINETRLELIGKGNALDLLKEGDSELEMKLLKDVTYHEFKERLIRNEEWVTVTGVEDRELGLFALDIDGAIVLYRDYANLHEAIEYAENYYLVMSVKVIPFNK